MCVGTDFWLAFFRLTVEFTSRTREPYYRACRNPNSGRLLQQPVRDPEHVQTMYGAGLHFWMCLGLSHSASRSHIPIKEKFHASQAMCQARSSDDSSLTLTACS